MSTIWVSGRLHSWPTARFSWAILASVSSPGSATSATFDPRPKSTAGRKSFSAATVISTLWVRTTLAPNSQASSASAAEATSRS